MVDAQAGAPPPVIESAPGVALLRFASELFACADLAELEHTRVAGFGRLIHAPMHTLYVLDPQTRRPVRAAPAKRQRDDAGAHERLPQGRESDPLLERVLATRGAAYNIALLSTEEWLESPIYTNESHESS